MSTRMIAVLFSLLLAAPAYANTVPIVVIGDTVAAPSGTANSVEWRHKTAGVASGDTLQSGGKTFQRDGTGAAVKLNDSAAANPTAKIVRQSLACDAPNGIFNGQCKPPCANGFSWDAAGTCECPAPKTVTAGVCSSETFAWRVTPAGICSTACGGGTKNQTVVCEGTTSHTVVSDASCAAAGPKPPSTLAVGLALLAGIPEVQPAGVLARLL